MAPTDDAVNLYSLPRSWCELDVVNTPGWNTGVVHTKDTPMPKLGSRYARVMCILGL